MFDDSISCLYVTYYLLPYFLLILLVTCDGRSPSYLSKTPSAGTAQLGSKKSQNGALAQAGSDFFRAAWQE
jgi:hypothetical protein